MPKFFKIILYIKFPCQVEAGNNTGQKIMTVLSYNNSQSQNLFCGIILSSTLSSTVEVKLRQYMQQIIGFSVANTWVKIIHEIDPLHYKYLPNLFLLNKGNLSR